MALPFSPGFGPSLYHATFAGFFGTPISPLGVRPTNSNPASTFIAGMISLFGGEAGTGAVG